MKTITKIWLYVVLGLILFFSVFISIILFFAVLAIALITIPYILYFQWKAKKRN